MMHDQGGGRGQERTVSPEPGNSGNGADMAVWSLLICNCDSLLSLKRSPQWVNTTWVPVQTQSYPSHPRVMQNTPVSHFSRLILGIQMTQTPFT